MAKSVLDIVIKMVKEGGGDKETVKSLVDLKATIGGAVTAFGVLAATGATLNTIYQNTVTVFVDYAEKVRDTMRLTGMTATETSKLIQAADDLNISYEALQKSLWNASKNGIDISVDSLANLADQYVAIQSPAERATFLAKNFGKSGAEMGKLLEEGGNGVRKATDAIEGNLVLTEEQVRQAEEVRLAVDAMSDAWEGMKVAAGSALGSIIANTAATRDMTAEAVRWGIIHDGMNDRMKNSAFEAFRGQMERGAAMTQYYNAQLKETSEAAQQSAEEIKAMSSANQGLLGLIGQLQSENDRYNQSLAGIQEKYASSSIDLEIYKSKKQELVQSLRDGTITASEYSTQLNDIYKGYQDGSLAAAEQKKEVDALAAQHEDASKRIAFSLLQQKAAMDGLTDNEFQGLLSLGQQWGIYDDTVVQSALAMDQQMNSMANSLGDPTSKMTTLNGKVISLSKLSGSEFDFTVNIKTNGYFPAMPGANTTNTPHVGDASGRAAGGPLDGPWTLVGDRPGGVFVPGLSELIWNGQYVFDSATSEALLRSGMVGNIVARGNAGDVYTSGGGVSASLTNGLQNGNNNAPGKPKPGEAPKPGKPAPDDSPSMPTTSTGPSNSTVTTEISNAAASIETSVSNSAATAAQAAQASAAMQQTIIQTSMQQTAAIQAGNENMVAAQNRTNNLLQTLNSTLPGQMVAAFVQANP